MKKFISLFLVFSILLLSGNLYAKERRGADIEIYKTKPKMEGTPWETPDIRGELIAVKENSLLLLDSESGTDVSVDINEIYFIKNVRKSKVLLGACLGFAIAGGGGALLGKGETMPGMEGGSMSSFLFVLFGIGGALIGGLIGGFASADEKIQIQGKSDSEIQEILEELRKKARVKNYQ